MIEYSLRALEAASSSSNDGYDIAITAIGIICLALNLIGFLLFYFNQSRKSFDALLPNLIMFAFFFSGWINFISIIIYQYSFFYTNNPLQHILKEGKIYEIVLIREVVDNLQNYSKVVNVVIFVMSFVISITVEIFYCFESIHIFQNPVASTKVRRVVYLLLGFCVFTGEITHIIIDIYRMSSSEVIDDGDFWDKFEDKNKLFDMIYEHLKFTSPLILLFYGISLTSVIIIVKSNRTQSVLFQQDKSVFLKKHIFYVCISVICLGYPLFCLLYNLLQPQHPNPFIIKEVVCLLINCNGIFATFVRILEIDMSFLFECCHKKPKEIQNILMEDTIIAIGEFANKAPLLPNESGSQASFEKDPDISQVRDNDERFRKAPMSSKIMMNFLSESVFYTLNCILHSSARSLPNISIIKDDSYRYVNENNFRINNHEIEKIETKTKIPSGKRNCIKRLMSFMINRVKIIEYAPEVFHNLQKLDKIGTEEIKKSFNIRDNYEGLSKFHGSEGKSGSIFFFTHDKKFILKTISKGELDALINNLLKPYYELIAEKNRTYLTRLYGAYSLKIGRSEIHLVLMENISPFSEDAFVYKYDLKGSWVGRKTKNIFSSNNKTLKDLDYLDIANKERSAKVLLKEEVVTLLKREMNDDLNLLMNARLMDYSLFIVIAKKKKIDKKKLSISNRVFYSAINEEYVYLMGIIDYLTRYGKKKILENSVRGCFNDSKGISCVEPKDYRDRFYQFMFKHVLISEDEDEEEDILEQNSN